MTPQEFVAKIVKLNTAVIESNADKANAVTIASALAMLLGQARLASRLRETELLDSVISDCKKYVQINVIYNKDAILACVDDVINGLLLD